MTSSEMRNVGFSLRNRSTNSSKASPAIERVAALTFSLIVDIVWEVLRVAAASRRRAATIPAREAVRHQSFVRRGSRRAKGSLGIGTIQRGQHPLDRALEPQFGGVGEETRVVTLAGPQTEGRHSVHRHEL